MKTIIFICKYNVFRSRVAEAYFNKINTNKKWNAISRGLIMGGNSDAEQREIVNKILDIKITKRKPMPVTLQELIKSDLIVVVAEDIPEIIFNYQLINLQKRLVIWKIKDEQKKNKENIKKILILIKDKVDKLNKELEKRK